MYVCVYIIQVSFPVFVYLINRANITLRSRCLPSN